MFTTGQKWLSGHQPGEHDSIRDGESSGKMDTRKCHVVYAPLADWLAAGNEKP